MKVLISRDGQDYGPYTRKVVDEHLQSRRLSLEDWSWSPGLAEGWIRLKELLELLENGGQSEEAGEGDRESGTTEEDLEDPEGVGEVSLVGGDEEDPDEEEEGEEDSDEAVEIDPPEGSCPPEIGILDAMVADCREFRELEGRLSNFNLWNIVPPQSYDERSHHKMLEWLFSRQTHNLGNLFLRRWLIRILKDDAEDRPLNPLNIEYARFIEWKVNREQPAAGASIDLFLNIKTRDQGRFLVVVEVKIWAPLGPNQLQSYRQWALENYDSAKNTVLFVLLYDKGSRPQVPQVEDPHWIQTTFDELRQVLMEVMEESGDRIPGREKDFIEQYMENLPPISPAGRAEDLESMTYAIYNKFWKGIDYANKATEVPQPDDWQIHAKKFCRQHPEAFEQLTKHDRTGILKKELIKLIEDRFGDVDAEAMLSDGIDILELKKDWNVPEPKLRVTVEIFLRVKTVKLRLRVHPTNESKAPDRLDESFSSAAPPRYGGNDGAIGNIIYNKRFVEELQLKSKNHLSAQARIIFEAFVRIWHQDEEFQIGLKTIENHLKGTP